MVSVDPQRILKICPHVIQPYWQAVGRLNADLEPFDILVNARRLAHFLAQILHESSALTVLRENLYYTTTERLRTVWPHRFRTPLEALPFLRNPEALANHVYGNRPELGNVNPGDGWKFRGRGPLQLTGGLNYLKVDTRLGIGLVEDPDLACEPELMFRVAGAKWAMDGLNQLADRDDITKVSKRIVGDTRTVPERARWLKRVRVALGPDVLEV